MMINAVMSVILAAQPLNASSDDLDRIEAAWKKSRKCCGPISLCYSLNRLGVSVSALEIASQMDFGERGVRADELVDLARRYRPEARAMVGNSNDFESLPVPSILILDSQHCVVFDGFTSEGDIRIFEPADGKRKTAVRDRLSQRWTGEVIVFERPAMTWPTLVAWCLIAFSGTLLVVRLGVSIVRTRR